MEKKQIAIAEYLYQCRLTKTEKVGKKSVAVNYDSTLIFPSEEMAEVFLPMFEQQVRDMLILEEKDKVEKSIVQLATYLPQVSEK